MEPNILTGNLKFLNLGDLLQLLGANGVTGTLRIRSNYAQEPGIIYLIKGNPVHAVSESQSGIDALYALFGWVDGNFEFSDEPVTQEKTIAKNRMEIILDGLRMLDDGKIKKLGFALESDQVSEVSSKYCGTNIRGPRVDYMYVVDEEEFSEGQEIVKEKRHGNWIWVILEGHASIIKETPRGPLKINTLSEGSFIGSLASFTIEGNVRNATVVAESKVHLGVLDTQRLATEFSLMSPEFKGILFSLDRRSRQVTDRTADIYSGRMEPPEHFKKKKPLIKQGDTENKLFVIKRGEASVASQIGKTPVLLAHLIPGDFFGPVPFMDIGHEPASASVFADDIEYSNLNPDRLQREYDRISTTVRNIIDNLAACVSYTSIQACEYAKQFLNNK